MKRSAWLVHFALFLGFAMPAFALAENRDAVDAARLWRRDHIGSFMQDFKAFLSLPNDGADASELEANAQWVRAYLTARGFTAHLWQTGGPPMVFAERLAKGRAPTLLIYAHYDGQPVGTGWQSSAFTPILRTDPLEKGGIEIDWPSDISKKDTFEDDFRLFARSASDDKATIMAIAAAIEALDAFKIAPSVGIKIILDGEEEKGSPHLAKTLEAHKNDLSSDLIIFADAPQHASGKPTLIFGNRGVMGLTITSYGANRPLHAGHYGNWAPSPSERLIRLLSSLKNERGEVTVAGFDQGARLPSKAAQTAIDALPLIDTKLLRELDLAGTNGTSDRLELQNMKPGLSVIDFRILPDTQKANVIPQKAQASLDIRLAAGQDPALIRRVIERHIFTEGYVIAKEEPTGAYLQAHDKVVTLDWKAGVYPAYQTDLEDSNALKLVASLSGGGLERPLLVPMMGGSLPLSIFADILHKPVIIFPISNPDNNQHGANENIRLGHIFQAIDQFAAIFARFGRE